MGLTELGRRLRDLPLFWQIFLPNVLVLAVAAGVLALSPASVSSRPSSGQALGLFIALVVIVLINLILIRRAVAPVERLTQVMARVDPLEPGQRAPTDGGSAETRQLAEVFNAMLQRLETERRDSGARMLSAQERERVPAGARATRRDRSERHRVDVGDRSGRQGGRHRASTPNCARRRRRRGQSATSCARSSADCARRRWTTSGCTAPWSP